ncbi:MAG: DUF370 domain-containing protein [Oscillospiraceae bacterium]
MYLHLGQDIVVRLNDVIGIFDIETASTGRVTRKFLARAEQKLLITNVSSELPKSFVVCQGDDGLRIYISQISTSTLRKRADYVRQLTQK